MKTRNTILVFALIALASLCFTACNNPIMKEWWDGGSSSAGEVNSGGETPAFQGIFYTVHFDPNDGSTAQADYPAGHPADQLVAEGSRIIEPLPGEAKSTVGFAGWCIDSNNNGILEPSEDIKWDFSIPLVGSSHITGDTMTLYAKWASDPCMVTFDSNGGSARPRTQVVAKDTNALIEPAAGTKKGYGFAGWYESPSFGGEPWNFDDLVTSDMTLYAKWGLPDCTVVFEAFGGSPVPEAQELAAGQTIVEPPSMSRPGHGFSGWYTNPACTGDPWDFSNPATGTVIILYAKWVTNEYKITFVANGGTPAPGVQAVLYGNHIERPPLMEKTEQGFRGWFTDSAFTDEWDFLNDTVSGNITLYAKWERAEYTLTFDSAGGSPVELQLIVAGGKAIRPTDPTRSAYAFKGWYTTRDPNDRTLWNFDKPITNAQGSGLTFQGENVILYARWVKHNPLIVYIPGGTFSMGGLGGAGSSDRPAHTVTISGFYMYPFEMNQNAFHAMHWWKKYNGGDPTKEIPGYNAVGYSFDLTTPLSGPRWAYNPSRAKGMYRPVESITWYDAVYFCNLVTEYENKVTRKGVKQFEPAYTIMNITWADGEGTSIISADVTLNPKVKTNPEVVGYRLPTEAEWEYAARGGDGSPGNYPWAGSDTANDVAWSTANTTVTHEPREKLPNRFGLYDMSGNVCEWLWDKYDPDYYKPSNLPDNALDPLGPSKLVGPLSSDYGEERTRRGGSIRHGEPNCRTQVRDKWGADRQDNWNIGLRIIRTGEE